jgi:HNH endonuclease
MLEAVRAAASPAHPRAHDAEQALVALARSANPLRRALARVTGRMVATRGWERLGFARLADYASERAGVSARELRDLAAVDRALATLPALDRAFAAGDLGWTQLRLLCRVARREDETEWLALARRLTASALAREVRAVDRVARAAEAGVDALADDGDARVGVTVRCTPEVRARWWHARQVAHRVAGHTLSHAEFAEAVTAEVFAAIGLESAPEPPVSSSVENDAKSVPSETSQPRERETSHREASVLPWVVALTRDLDAADAFELDARLRRALALEMRRLSRVAVLLERVAVWGLHRKAGFATLEAYAEERLGMAPSRARALLRIARAASVCPSLRVAFARGQLSWVQAHTLVSLLFEPGAARHREAWVRHAAQVSARRLADDVERALAAGVFAPPPLGSPHSTHLQIGAIARASAHGRLERARIFFAAPPEVAQLFRCALATVQRRLEHLYRRPASQSEALSEMLAHALATWLAHDPHDRTRRDTRVFERDGWRCTVPGCSSYRNLHGHHIVFRSQSGSDDLANLTTLCAWHHQRGVHAGRVRCRGAAPHALHFALGLRPHHPPLLAYGPGEVLARESSEADKISCPVTPGTH